MEITLGNGRCMYVSLLSWFEVCVFYFLHYFTWLLTELFLRLQIYHENAQLYDFCSCCCFQWQLKVKLFPFMRSRLRTRHMIWSNWSCFRFEFSTVFNSSNQDNVKSTFSRSAFKWDQSKTYVPIQVKFKRGGNSYKQCNKKICLFT